MTNFNNVRRGTTITVTPILDADIEGIRHWMEELGITGWTICDGAEVRLHLGDDYPLVTELPVWPDMPEFSKTNNVSYFVSFYNAGDIKAKLAEILSSQEHLDWKVKIAGEAAKAHAYQEAFAKDPSPFDFRRDLK